MFQQNLFLNLIFSLWNGLFHQICLLSSLKNKTRKSNFFQNAKHQKGKYLYFSNSPRYFDLQVFAEVENTKESSNQLYDLPCLHYCSLRTTLSHSAASARGQPPSQLYLLETTDIWSSERVWTAARNLHLQECLRCHESGNAQGASTEEGAVPDQRTTKAIDEPHRDCKQEWEPWHISSRILGESILERGVSSRVRRGSIPVTVTLSELLRSFSDFPSGASIYKLTAFLCVFENCRYTHYPTKYFLKFFLFCPYSCSTQEPN